MAFFNQVLLIGINNPIMTSHSPRDYSCSCRLEFTSRVIQTTSRNETLQKACLREGGTLEGSGCETPNYVPDVFLFSFILFISTYIISVILKDFKSASFFPAKVRAVISDFAVVIAIFSMTALDMMVGINTPKLLVPQEFKVSGGNFVQVSNLIEMFQFNNVANVSKP